LNHPPDNADPDYLEHFGFERDERNMLIKLGRGMAGFTYRGWVDVTRAGQNGPERTPIRAALKEVNRTTEGDGYSLKREVMLLGKVGRLGHPGLVKFLRFFYHNHTPIIATELVEGETLETTVKRAVEAKKLDSSEWLRKALEWALHLASALECLHQAGVVHRDIKPANIVLRMEDQLPVLIDFGIGKSEVYRGSDGGTSITRDRFVGTPAFASPEQFCTGPETCEWCAVQPCRLSTKSDIYSLGVTLYYALTGKLLFERESSRFRDHEMLIRLKHGALSSTAVQAELRGAPITALATLLARCLHPEAQERPTPAELRNELEIMLERDLHLPTTELETLRSHLTEEPLPLELLPRFVPLLSGVQIAANLLPNYAYDFWTPGPERVDFDENASAPTRKSFDEALALVGILNTDRELANQQWSYRLPTPAEWMEAAGLRDGSASPAGARPRRIYEDLGREHEWCDAPRTSAQPECREVRFLNSTEVVTAQRHRLWPKGAIRLVRQNRVGQRPTAR
jgi:serine/threonine protein kinase